MSVVHHLQYLNAILKWLTLNCFLTIKQKNDDKSHRCWWNLVNLQEYLVFDGASMQTVSANGQHTSFESANSNFNQFILIDEFDSIIVWMHEETELHVSNNTHYMSAVKLLLLKVVLPLISSESTNPLIANLCWGPPYHTYCFIIIMTHRQLWSVATTLHDVHVPRRSATSVSSWLVFPRRPAVSMSSGDAPEVFAS